MRDRLTAEAQSFYESIRADIYPLLKEWEADIDQIIDARIEAAG